MKKGGLINLVLIIVIGFTGGIFFIPPLPLFTEGECSGKNLLICEILHSLGFNYNQIMSGFLGIAVLFLLIFIVINIKPEVREKTKENLKNLWTGKNRIGINIGNFFTHPTQIPITVGLIWFLIGIFLIYLTETFFERPFNQSNSWLNLLIFFLPPLISVGLSGLLMAVRKETVDKNGNIHRGFWAVFSGIMAMLFGWGLSIFFISAYIFNW